MIVIAIIFWILIFLAIFGGIMHLIDIAKGKTSTGVETLPKPIKKVLGKWF